MAADGDADAGGAPDAAGAPDTNVSIAQHQLQRNSVSGRVGQKTHGKKQVVKTEVVPPTADSDSPAEEPAIFGLVFSYLSATTLGRAIAVCKSWYFLGQEESLWRSLCVTNWPATASKEAAALVVQAGGYQKLFRCRQIGVPIQPKQKPRPWMKIKSLHFLLDISYKGKSIFSKLIETPKDYMRNSWFELCIPIPNFHTDTVPASEIVQRTEAAALQFGLEADESISKKYLEDLRVDWSAIRTRDYKMVCLMSGQPVGRGGTVCLPQEDEDHYKVEFEQPLALEPILHNILQITEGELSSFASISVELIYEHQSKLRGCLKVTEIQLGMRLGFNEWATMGKAMYCLQHLRWR